MIAKLRHYRISPKKANLVAALVRNKTVSEAVDMLKFTDKKMAPVLKKLVESAAANAVNNFKQNFDSLYIKEIIVNEGPTLKRHIPISRGRVHPIRKRTSHLTVKLGTITAPTPEVKDEKEEEKKTEKKAETKKTK